MLPQMPHPSRICIGSLRKTRNPHSLRYYSSDGVPNRDRTRPSFEFAIGFPTG